jgi:hypothetical protein
MTRSDSERIKVTRGEPMRLGMTQSNSVRRNDAKRTGTTYRDRSHVKLPGVTVTEPESLSAQHIHPDMSGTLRMRQYPPIAHWRVSTRETSSACPSSHTPGVITMPVPAPVMRPVDPTQPTRRKRPQPMSASRTFDTNDPLQNLLISGVVYCKHR